LKPGHPILFPDLIGMSRALHLTTVSVYLANHPLLHQLFSEITSTEATVARALQLADDIANNTSAISTKLMPGSMYHGPDSAEGTNLLDSRLIYSLFGSKDNEEGVKSFIEKRSPHFGGTVPADAPEVYLWWNPTDVGSKPQVSSPGGKAKL
jgi:enoyl-CoA hydratase/carnithine racemase